MKARLVVLALLVAVGAGATEQQMVVVPDWVRFESDKGPLLLGRVDQTIILADEPEWAEELEGWQPEQEAVAALAAVETDVEMLVVLGTWCGDSRREVPRLWRLLEDVDNPRLHLKMVAVGRTGDSAARAALESLGLGGDFRQENGIEKVATIIVSHAGVELGRIVEAPEVSLGADLVAILSGAELVGQTDPQR